MTEPRPAPVPVQTVRLRQWLERERGVKLADYEALRRWSVADVGVFWQAMWDYFDLRSPSPFTRVLAEASMPGARWFEGAQVNYASQVARHAAAGVAAGVPAIVFRNERLMAEGRTVEIGWGELVDQAAALAASLRSLGVRRGDRVAAYLPNIPEAMIAFLACASLGAIWSLTAPDMGVGTVRDRFRQIEPKVLIACDGTVYGGKVADRRALVKELLGELPSVETLVLVPYLERAGAAGQGGFDEGGARARVRLWSDLLAHGGRVAPEPVPFDHLLWQPFHLDHAAAAATHFGGLVGSGWMSCAIMMRLLCDHFISRVSSMGSPGVDRVRWLRPVRPGDRLRARVRVVKARISETRPDRGIVSAEHELVNQRDEVVMTMGGNGFYLRRPQEPGTRTAPTAPAVPTGR